MSNAFFHPSYAERTSPIQNPSTTWEGPALLDVVNVASSGIGKSEGSRIASELSGVPSQFRDPSPSLSPSPPPHAENSRTPASTPAASRSERRANRCSFQYVAKHGPARPAAYPIPPAISSP